MTKPASKGMSIDLQFFADNGSAEGGQTPANAEEQLTNAFGGANAANAEKPADKPDTGNTDAGGKQSESETKLAAWAEQLPPDMRTNAETAAKLAKFPKIGELAKAYLELDLKAASGFIPGKEATAEEVVQFWDKLGRPKKADGYAFAKNKDGSVFADAAFKANLTSVQADAMYKNLSELGNLQLKAAQEAQAQQLKTTVAELSTEYGSKYEAKMEFLKRGLAAAGPNIGNLLSQAGLAGNPEIIKAFIQFGEMTAESGSARGKGAGDSLKSIFEGGSPEFKT